MKKFGQSPNETLIVWIIRLSFGFSLLIFVFINLKIFEAAYILAGMAGIALIYLLFFFWGYKIELKSNFLQIEKGIIFRTTLIIPYEKIVYINRLKTPLTKAFGIFGGIIKTVNGTVFILEQTEELLLLLSQKIEENEK